MYQVSESGDPDTVRGSYRISLPDGRVQTVTYEVQYLVDTTNSIIHINFLKKYNLL